MEYTREYFDDVIVDLLPLLQKHWAEVELHQDKMPLNPNWEQYRNLESSGALHIFTARDGDALAGYCVVFTAPNIHHCSNLVSSVDALYVAPPYRGRMTGSILMTYVEKELEKIGVSTLLCHVKTLHDFSPLLVRKGYQEAEKVFSKYIGD